LNTGLVNDAHSCNQHAARHWKKAAESMPSWWIASTRWRM